MFFIFLNLFPLLEPSVMIQRVRAMQSERLGERLSKRLLERV